MKKQKEMVESFLESLNEFIKSDVFYFDLEKNNKTPKTIIGNKINYPVLNLHVRNKKEKIGYLLSEEKIFYNLLDAEMQQLMADIDDCFKEKDEVKKVINIHELKIAEYKKNVLVAWLKKNNIKSIDAEINRLINEIAKIKELISDKQEGLVALGKIKPENESIVKMLAKIGIVEKKLWLVKKTKRKTRVK